MKKKEIEDVQFSFPPIWYKLHSDLNKESQELSLFLAENSIPCDLSIQPSLWGHFLSKWTGLCLIKGSFDYENTTDSRHVHDLITAYLLQILCSVKRQRIDFFVIPIRKKIPQHILQGIEETIQQAKDENLIKFFGLYLLDSSKETLELSTFHSFTDAIVIAENSIKDFENFDFGCIPYIFYETSYLRTKIKPTINQIISIKSMSEIYEIRDNLSLEERFF